MEPINIGNGYTISNKPFGIAVYFFMEITTKRLFSSTKHEMILEKLETKWYKKKEDQLKALYDLCSNEKTNMYKYIPFKNNYKSLPIQTIPFKHKELIF